MRNVWATLADREITVANMKQHLPPKDMNSLQNCYRQKTRRNQEDSLAFSSIKDKKEKLALIQQWVVEPETSVSSGLNSWKKKLIDANETDYQWMTREQIAEILQSESHAQLVCDGGELDDRPHELKTLADKGVMQYWLGDGAIHYNNTNVHQSKNKTHSFVLNRR